MPGEERRSASLKWLIVVAALLLVFGAFQFLVHTFPGVILSGMYRYYAWQAGVKHHVATIEDYRIPYYRGGKGPTLILLHGFGDSKISFLQSAAFLTEHYEVILPDLPGFGETEKMPGRNHSIRRQTETLEGLVRHLKVEKFHLGGNSMGGHISAAYALRNPEQLLSLILLNSAGLRVDDPVPYKPSRAPLRSVEDFDQYIKESFVREPFVPHAFKLHFVSNSIEHFDWLNAIRTEIRQGEDYVLNGSAKQIETQTLIIWGDGDTIVSPAHAQVWSQLLPNSTLIILDETGHAPQYERPEDTARIIRSFLMR